MTCPAPESIHPALWRASQLARAAGRTVTTGYPMLSRALPGGGWPTGTLVELLVQQAGVGEMRLLRPALVEVSKRPIAMIQPPHTPQALAFANLGLPPQQLLWIRGQRTADALWAAEQLLRAGTCGALLLGNRTSATTPCAAYIWPRRAARRCSAWCGQWPARATRRPPPCASA